MSGLAVVLASPLVLDLSQSGLRFGEGLFETLRVQGGRIWHLDWHLERLAKGCAFLGMEAPPDAPSLLTLLQPELEKNPHGVLRLWAVDLHLYAFLSPPLPSDARFQIGINHGFRRWSTSPLNAFKTMSYLENRLLQKEADKNGLFDVLMLNEHGLIADGSRSTLMVFNGGHFLTPPQSHGALPGIARRALLEAGLALEAPLLPEDLEGNAFCMVNALRGIRQASLRNSLEALNTQQQALLQRTMQVLV